MFKIKAFEFFFLFWIDFINHFLSLSPGAGVCLIFVLNRFAAWSYSRFEDGFRFVLFIIIMIFALNNFYESILYFIDKSIFFVYCP